MQEVEEKRALPKTLDYCLFIAMSLLSFHFSRGTNGKGSWFIVWLKMHWKESNFPLKTVKTQRIEVLLEWGKAEPHYCQLSIWNMGYATVKAGKKRPLQKITMGGPQALALQEAGTAELAGLKGLSCMGGDHVHHCPHKGTFLGLYLSEVLEKDP